MNARSLIVQAGGARLTARQRNRIGRCEFNANSVREARNARHGPIRSVPREHEDTMNKLVLASLAVLIAGATVSPAFAIEDRRAAGEPAAAETVGKGPYREAAEAPREERDTRRDDREGAVRDGRGGREAGEDGDTRTRHRPDVRVSPPVATAQVRTGYGEWSRDRDHDGDRDGSRDWNRDRGGEAGDHGRDGNRDRDRDHDDDRYGDRHRDHDSRGDWQYDRHDWRSDDRRDGRYYTRYRDVRWSGYNWYPQYRYRASTRYIYPYGYRPYRWTVGYRMPYAFYSPRSYWLDWRMYRLPPPPYGYQWVRVDRDVVLVSMATGYVRDVLYGVFW
jgi:Ni/Co efflux regulator RcnB